MKKTAGTGGLDLATLKNFYDTGISMFGFGKSLALALLQMEYSPAEETHYSN